MWYIRGWNWDDQDCDIAHDYSDIGFICQFGKNWTFLYTRTESIKTLFCERLCSQFAVLRPSNFIIVHYN
jgi:hypothetical protein